MSNLRASSYTIYVALPGNDDEMVLVHGYTGAYNKVSRTVANFVRSLESGPPPKPLYGDWSTEPAAQIDDVIGSPLPSSETMDLLAKRGFLTGMSVDEEVGYLARTVKSVHKRASQSSPSFLFMPTYNCNLRCAYCFQDHMRTDTKFRHLLRTISREMVDRVLSSFPAIEETHGIAPRHVGRRRVGFFGGEPLLAESRPIVEYIMNRAQAMGPVDFWAVTNATELESYTDLLGADGISYIQITMDGPPEEHDKRRIYADGSGSFTRIAANLDLSLSLGVKVSLRMNIDRSNIQFLPAFADMIVERGWHKSPNFSAYTAPITNASQQTTLVELRQKFFTSWELDQAISTLRTEHENMRVIGRPDDQMISRARSLLENQADATASFKSSFCGAHTGMYLFDAFGDIYACWERTGDPTVRIGRVKEDGQLEMNESVNRMWRTRTSASNPTCRKCRYALNCGGGCAVLAEGRSGKMHSNHCDDYADRFRHSVAVAYGSLVSGTAVMEQERICDL